MLSTMIYSKNHSWHCQCYGKIYIIQLHQPFIREMQMFTLYTHKLRMILSIVIWWEITCMACKQTFESSDRGCNKCLEVVNNSLKHWQVRHEAKHTLFKDHHKLIIYSDINKRYIVYLYNVAHVNIAVKRRQWPNNVLLPLA